MKPRPNPSLSSVAQPRTHTAVLLILGLTHLPNDLIQSLIPAIYPIVKDSCALDFVQIGIITFTFQMAGSLLQPVVGYVADRRPMPYSTIVGMTFTPVGLASLGFASGCGLNFGLAGIAAAVLGGLADSIDIESVYRLCAFLPLTGLLTWFLPRMEDGAAAGRRHG